MKLNDFIGNWKILGLIPPPVLKATFAFVLFAGLLFFLTHSYDMRLTNDSFKDFPLTDVVSICVDDGSTKECQQFQKPKKVRVTTVTVQKQNEEKIINIQLID